MIRVKKMKSAKDKERGTRKRNVSPDDASVLSAPKRAANYIDYDHGLGFGNNFYGGHPSYSGHDAGMNAMVHGDRPVIVPRTAKNTRKAARINGATVNGAGQAFLKIILQKVVETKEPMSPQRAKPPPMTLFEELEALNETDGCIANAEEFDCIICMATTKVGDGVVLRLCLHQFCSECIKSTITLSEEAEIACPFGDAKNKCDGVISDTEIRVMVSPEEYDKHLTRSLRIAERTMENTVHCKKINCDVWCICDEMVYQFTCPKCESPNCISCQAIHIGLSCQQYQEKLKHRKKEDRTTKYLEQLIAKNEAMKCPKCQIIVMKQEGCDWLLCSMCKTEICWATKQARWGPKGKGDISGGCRCQVNGRICHPQCGYCH